MDRTVVISLWLSCVNICATYIWSVYWNVENCLLSNNVSDYYYVAQGKTTIPNVDDGEECKFTDVSVWETQQNHRDTAVFIIGLQWQKWLAFFSSFYFFQ